MALSAEPSLNRPSKWLAGLSADPTVTVPLKGIGVPRTMMVHVCPYKINYPGFYKCEAQQLKATVVKKGKGVLF